MAFFDHDTVGIEAAGQLFNPSSVVHDRPEKKIGPGKVAFVVELMPEEL